MTIRTCPTCSGTGWAVGKHCWCDYMTPTIVKGAKVDEIAPWRWQNEVPVGGPLQKAIAAYIKREPFEIKILLWYTGQWMQAIIDMDRKDHGIQSEADFAAQYPGWEKKLSNVEDGEGLNAWLRWAAPLDPFGTSTTRCLGGGRSPAGDPETLPRVAS